MEWAESVSRQVVDEGGVQRTTLGGMVGGGHTAPTAAATVTETAMGPSTSWPKAN